MTTKEKPRILFATGTTGSGKSTLAGNLVSKNSFRMLPAETTRRPRDSDLPGEFNHLTDVQFDAINPDDMLYTAQHGEISVLGRAQPPRYTLLRSVVEVALNGKFPYVRPLAPKSTGILLREFGAAAIKVIYLPSPDPTEAERRIVERGGDPAILSARRNDEGSWDELARQTPGIYIAEGITIAELHQEALELMGLG